jgi:hypothetical protein
MVGVTDPITPTSVESDGDPTASTDDAGTPADPHEDEVPAEQEKESPTGE